MLSSFGAAWFSRGKLKAETELIRTQTKKLLQELDVGRDEIGNRLANVEAQAASSTTDARLSRWNVPQRPSAPGRTRTCAPGSGGRCSIR